MKNYRYILIGPPGVGKGTHAKTITKKLNIPHISTGEIFRENIRNNTKLGSKANSYIKSGKLVPDEITNGIVANRLLEKDCENGFLLDGYPRNINQAKSLSKFLEDNKIKLGYALNFTADNEIIIMRLGGRRVCPKCDTAYHIKNNKPKKENICDNCNTKLITRKDDNPDVIKTRLEVYNKTSKDLIKYYKEKNELLTINANEDAKTLADKVVAQLMK